MSNTAVLRAVFVSLFFLVCSADGHTQDQWDRAMEVEQREVKVRGPVEHGATLTVEIVDAETGRPAAAMIRLLDRDGHLWIPDQAAAITKGGEAYDHRIAHTAYQYRTGYTAQGKFACPAGFEITLPGGSYSLSVRKGREYLGHEEWIVLGPDQKITRRVELKRWINMPKQGWYSGDGHLHYSRPSRADNDRLMTWLQAADLHVGNILQMDDATRTYFPQYAFGREGRYQQGNYVLVSGEEGPRNDYLGHFTCLNTKSLIVEPEKNYYLYNDVAEEARRQGGIPVFDHMTMNGDVGVSAREIALSAHRGVTTTGQMTHGFLHGLDGWEPYYNWLNLGYKLHLSAGSDVPWAQWTVEEGTPWRFLGLGHHRVYVYTGRTFNVDRWFEALDRGNTFVSYGDYPLLTVNGKLPGSEIIARAGDVVRIEAEVHVSPENKELTTAELLVGGEVAASNKQKDKGVRVLKLRKELRVERSTWIACRSTYGHTSAVYVRVGDEPWWNVKEFKRLVARQYQLLDEIEQMETVGKGRDWTWENDDYYQKQRPELLRRVKAAREYYRRLENRFDEKYGGR